VANRFALDADFRPNGPLCVAQTMEFNDSLVVLMSALAALLFSLLRLCCSSFAGRWDFDCLLFRCRVGKAKFTAPFLQCSFDGGGEIQEQMKPIGHLDCVGSTFVNLLDPIQYQVLSRQDRLRMARRRCHCKLSLKQSYKEMFGLLSPD
jgi:hypothetical protein